MKSILKESSELRNALIRQWTRIWGKRFQTKVAEDAKENGGSILRGQVNRYIHEPESYKALNETQILWLCKRYNIEVGLSIKVGAVFKKDFIKKHDTQGDNSSGT